MQIEPHEIHIWSANLVITPEQENNKMALLSMDEREKALRFHFPIHRQRYIAARSTLREILSFYLTSAPQDIVFSYSKNEKPLLLIPRESPLQFNLSHSDDLAIYALTLHHPIGIDVEKIKESYHPGIAERFFSSQENNELMRLPVKDRIIGFYRIWSRKEAIIKATGKGLSTPLSAFSVSATDKYETIVLNQDERWSLFPLFIQNGYQAAVATYQSVKKIRYWSLFDHHPLMNKVTLL